MRFSPLTVTETGEKLPNTTSTFAAGTSMAGVSPKLVNDGDSLITVAIATDDGHAVSTPGSATGTAPEFTALEALGLAL